MVSSHNFWWVLITCFNPCLRVWTVVSLLVHDPTFTFLVIRLPNFWFLSCLSIFRLDPSKVLGLMLWKKSQCWFNPLFSFLSSWKNSSFFTASKRFDLAVQVRILRVVSKSWVQARMYYNNPAYGAHCSCTLWFKFFFLFFAVFPIYTIYVSSCTCRLVAS